MFCGFTVFPERHGFTHRFSLRHDEDGEMLHDGIHALFVELTKLNEVIKKLVEQMTDIERFSMFLRYAESVEHRDLVNRIIESKEGLAVASELLMSISTNEDEKARFRSQRMYQMDQQSNMNAALRSERIAIAKVLLSEGDSIDKIVRVTNLTYRQVEALRGDY
jgi:hypothetical protein